MATKKTGITRDKIISMYMNYRLEHNEKPRSVFQFATKNGFDEKEFYTFFGTMESVEKEIFKMFLEKTVELIQKDTNYEAYDMKSKMLSFYFTFFELLSTQGNLQVLSSPRVSTVNNQKAVIKVGSDEFFVTEISSTTVTGTSTATTPQITLTPFFSGIALDVTPQISESGDVILHIHPSISEVIDQKKTITVAGQVQVLPLAFSSVRESDSVVRAKNGQIIVIGGLMKNKLVERESATPFLSEIPFLGQLFKHTSEVQVKSELVILLRPIVVDNDDVWSKAIHSSSDQVKQIYYDE